MNAQKWIAGLVFSAAVMAVAGVADAAGRGAKSCYQPCIYYKHVGLRKVCCSCEPPIKVVVKACDPGCCGCAVEVPMCIPACCTDAPCVTSRCGLFGRGIVNYQWKCGFRAQVVFTRHGDVHVKYFGRY